MESACGFCIGQGQAPKNNAVSVRTINRNFEGRSGTKTAQVYLVSPEVAVACALKGEFIDPRKLGIEYPEIQMPSEFLIDDSMIIVPLSDGSKVEIYRGPNIGKPLKTGAMPDSVLGEVLIKLGDKISTDHILPAGTRLKYRSNIPKYAEFVFEGVDSTFSKRAIEARDAGLAVFIIGGASYGQGSSREHAAICPAFLGVKAVIAKSFERIHAGNLVNFGVLPLTFANEMDYNSLSVGTKMKLINVTVSLEKGEDIIAEALDRKIKLKYNLSERQIKIVLVGGVLNCV